VEKRKNCLGMFISERLSRPETLNYVSASETFKQYPMAFDLHITIPDPSETLQVVQQLAAMEHITPDQAATQLLIEGAKRQSRKTPALEMLGAFSSDEDSAITDEAMEHVQAMRGNTHLRDFGV
jgi:chromosomal replication initiation ATPase DnaA